MKRISDTLKRRDLLKLSAAGVLSGVSVPWFESLASAAIARPRGKSCILLWMDGGPSQQHTFDPKPGGEFKSASTAVPGIHIVEQLPQLAQCMDDMALLRSMKTEINDHYDAKYYLHTGYKPHLRVRAPGDRLHRVVAARPARRRSAELRHHRRRVRQGERRAALPFGAGVPRPAARAAGGPRAAQGSRQPHAPPATGRRPAATARARRSAIRRRLRPAGRRAKQAAVDRAVRLMRSRRAKAFDLDEEPAKLRDAYGEHKFGQSCLLARRLVEAGVSFVEVFHRGWDDHDGAARHVADRAPWMDAGMSTLIRDLKDRGMLEDTLVVWMGEFGRSPGDGGGHFCNAWSTVWAGGGHQHGHRRRQDERRRPASPGGEVVDRPITAPDYVATLCTALGIDTHQEFMAPGQRPMPLVDKSATLVKELLR